MASALIDTVLETWRNNRNKSGTRPQLILVQYLMKLYQNAIDRGKNDWAANRQKALQAYVQTFSQKAGSAVDSAAVLERRSQFSLLNVPVAELSQEALIVDALSLSAMASFRGAVRLHLQPYPHTSEVIGAATEAYKRIHKDK